MNEATTGLRERAVTGTIWSAVNRIGYMCMQFAVNLILSRLLLPSDFGMIGMLMIFMAISQALIDGGFGAALIQKRHPTPTDYSTILYWNLAVALGLYIIIYVSAPAVGRFYRIEALESVLRVMGLSLLCDAVNGVMISRLRKRLSFRTLAISSLLAYAGGATTGITLALHGAGVWSLVAMMISAGLLNMGLMTLFTRGFPLRHFSLRSLRGLFSFGGYMLLSQLIQDLAKNIQGVVIGRKFDSMQTGLYSQAYKLDLVSSGVLPQIMLQVMYPIYSEVQDSPRRLGETLAGNVRVISFLTFPLLGFMILTSPSIISFLYGERWLAAAPYYRILCIGGLFSSLQGINFYAAAARGRGKTLLKYSSLQWGLMLVAVIAGSLGGMYGIIWSISAANLLIYLIDAVLADRYAGLPFLSQIKLLLPPGVSLAAGMGAGAAAGIAGAGMLIQGIIMVSVYLAISVTINRKSLLDCKMLIKAIKPRRY